MKYDPVEEAMKREREFLALIDDLNTDLAELRKMSWKGIPSSCRAKAWQIMIGYVPTCKARRSETLQRKRQEYREIVSQHFDPEKLANNPIFRQVCF